MRATLLLIFITLVSGCTPPSREPVATSPLPGRDYNVAILLVDTLRPDHLGCYGYERGTSPFIDSLAKEGVLFTNAHSPSTFTGEAVASIFTGRAPALNSQGLGWTARPTPAATSLPKILSAAGYRTGIFSTSFVMRFKGFYDIFDESELFPGQPNTTTLDGDLTDKALDFARRHRDKETFQYLHYYAPHAPYNPPAPWIDRFAPDRAILEPAEDIHPAALVVEGMTAEDPRLAELKKHYDGEIAFIDDAIRRYVEGLRALGTLERTILVVVSDHGEEFLEHGFADHAWNLHGETLRVPLLIWAPGLIAPGRPDGLVSTYDLAPTLLALLGITGPEASGIGVGHSLVVPGAEQWTVEVPSRPIVASLFPESRAQLHAVLFEGYKYIAGPRWLTGTAYHDFWRLQNALADEARRPEFKPLDPWAPPTREGLFNLRTDPNELQDLAGTEPEALETGRQLLREYRDAAQPWRKDAPATTTVDPFGTDTIPARLEALGDAPTPESDHGGEDRLDPEVIENLETMGYL